MATPRTYKTDTMIRTERAKPFVVSCFVAANWSPINAEPRTDKR